MVDQANEEVLTVSDQYRDSVRQMDRQIYEQLVSSLATGRWPDGKI